MVGCSISQFITKPQLSTVYDALGSGCSISQFITKPQHIRVIVIYGGGCSISQFITKPQLSARFGGLCEVVQYLNSSPNHNYLCGYLCLLSVVQYLNSSPNHNLSIRDLIFLDVVQYLNSSPNHNFARALAAVVRLFNISIHHQTTTCNDDRLRNRELFNISIHHQTTTVLLAW